MGFSHEQNRKDRDTHVEVLLENVAPQSRHNFAKLNSEAIRHRWYYTATGSETSITTTEVSGLKFPASAEIDVKLNGAMELAPSMGLCKRIVDLVETGSTLKANGLVVVEKICEVSTRLAVNRSYMKTNLNTIQPWIEKIEEAINV